MYKKFIMIFMVAAFALPSVSRADGSIIGTDVYALGNGSIANAFYQGKISEDSAFMVEVASDLGVNLFQGSYKKYFAGSYANAPFLAGGLLLATGGGSSVSGFFGKIGYDFTIGNNLVLSPYYGAGSVSGYNFGGVGFDVGYKF